LHYFLRSATVFCISGIEQIVHGVVEGISLNVIAV